MANINIIIYLKTHKGGGVIQGMQWGKKLLLVGVLCMIFGTTVTEAAANGDLIKMGMRGDGVGQVQQRLQEIGYYQGTVDGVFGSETKNAVVCFQDDQGLQADGVVGTATLQAIRSYHGDGPVSRRMNGSRLGEMVALRAKSYLGTPYVWGGTSDSGFDCSGFVWALFNQAGVSLPRMADEQFYAGYAAVRQQDLQPGDIVFFSTYEPGPSHAGIYIGGGAFVHASSAAGEVTITPLSKQYYAERYLGARRVLP